MMNINKVKKYLDNPIIALCVSISMTALIIYVYKNLNKIVTSSLFSNNEYEYNPDNKIMNDTSKIIVV